MGGIGSGRRGYGRKGTVDECLAIDVNWMRRQGLLRPGAAGKLTWTRGGRPSGDIQYTTESERLLLRFRHRSRGGEWEDTEQPLPLEWSPCRFGGVRPWFRCPGVVNGKRCRRRVLKVYSGGRYFLCRGCYSLAYHCQSEGKLDRLFRRADKLRRAMGSNYCLDEPPPFRPRGMHQRSYRRRLEAIERADRLLAMAVEARFGSGLNYFGA